MPDFIEPHTDYGPPIDHYDHDSLDHGKNILFKVFVWFSLIWVALAPDAINPQVEYGPPTDHHYYDSLIYDHDHEFDHDHTDLPIENETEEPEPEVKKYHHYPIRRILWYIPLLYGFWFSLYVISLIARSIGRKKVRI